jgi:hypothetical protein
VSPDIRPILLLIAVLAACGAAPPTSAACLTRSDCAAGEECISGSCTAFTRDAGLDAAALVDAPADDGGAEDASFVDVGTEDTGGENGEDASLDGGPGPMGESCANPIPIPLVAGRGHVTGTLDEYRADYDTFCGENDAVDVIFVLDVGAGVHDIDVVSGPADVDTVVAISDGCDEFYDCDDDRSMDDQGARIVLHRFPRERVYLMVKGFDRMSTGTFTLDVTVTDATFEARTCGTALDVTGGAKVISFPPATTSTLTTTCGGTSLQDTYRLAPEPDGTISSIFAWFGGDPRSVAVVNDCSAAPGESWCGTATFAGSAFTLFQGDITVDAAREHYVTILGAEDSGVYSLDVTP